MVRLALGLFQMQILSDGGYSRLVRIQMPGLRDAVAAIAPLYCFVKMADAQ
jgi:hypothetical protein